MNGAPEGPGLDDAGNRPDDEVSRIASEIGAGAFEAWVIPSQLPAARRLLRAARELIMAPETWTKGRWARDADGNPVLVGDDRAVSFCAAGAFLRAARIEAEAEISVDFRAELVPFHPVPLALAALAVAGGMHEVSASAAGRITTQADAWALLQERVFDQPDVIEGRGDGAAYLGAVLSHSLAEVAELNDKPEIAHDHVLRAYEVALEALEATTGGER